jgi:hypothetical protein
MVALANVVHSRAEATDLQLMHAVTADDEHLEEDHRGYFKDGAYTVAPQLGPDYPDYYDDEEWDENGGDYDENEPVEHYMPSHFNYITPFEAYTNSLLSRFNQLHDAIRKFRADPKLVAVPYNVPKYLRERRHDREIWSSIMMEQNPESPALAATPLKSLLALLYMIQRHHLQTKQNVHKNISLWILGLLAGIDEQIIDGDAMAELRELAKTALWLRIDFEPRMAEASAAIAAGLQNESDDGDTSSSSRQQANGESSHQVADAGAEEGEIEESGDDGAQRDTVPDDGTKATLDMIVLIVGEIFGQRDLLESRGFMDWIDADEENEEENEPDAAHGKG